MCLVMPFIALEQQSSFNKELSLTYIVNVNLGVLRLCYIRLSNNKTLPELSFLLRSFDTQITTSLGFPAELWNIPYLHYRIFKCLTWRQVDHVLDLSMKSLGIWYLTSRDELQERNPLWNGGFQSHNTLR